ncbi:nitrate reductase [Mesobacterium pallidum]|uniref:nitrate reductase n=1 Tax=Mesobacterium pallidum TaxID=2872037 RepID=UPI001EE184BA|nr:nitrate reductase [Mesobacterium pallidum]
MAEVSEIKSTCAYCGVGCGVLLRPDGAGGLSVRGDPDHPANFGRLCSKGAALGETVGHEARLLHPLVNGQRAGWDDALQTVADRFTETLADHGPGSVALYVSGQLLTEDYYVANKLAKGFMGTANIDTNSRLCMASTVAGHKRAFGTDTVPGQYTDLEEADLVVLVGSNLAWCHPVLFQRIAAARKARPGMRVVVIDPRRTASCDGADLHLAIAPGADVAVFNTLLRKIHEQGALDAAFLAHTEGFDAALEAAWADIGAETGLSDRELAEFCAMWLRTEKVVTVFSQGVNQSENGTDKVNAILNCHLATGRIGRPGMGPFSVTGQPNAMGGREVGGLANMLACHLDLENPAHREAVGRFWDAPVAIPDRAGLKAVDMFRAVGDGRIKAIWIIHTNPVVSLPEADAVRAAIEGCDFVVVSDITGEADTAKLAHVVLPATGWAEKDGTVTNSERRISRQRPVLPVPGEARPDWAILAEVGRRMGWQSAFSWDGPAEIFDEYARMSGMAAGFGRDFDISGLAGLSPAEFDAMAPVQWPVTSSRTGGRFFADGQFFHDGGKARFLPVSSPAPALPDGTLRLNTGRVRDQWHTMTRTGLSPRLNRHLGEPYLEIHPRDAEALGLEPAGLATVSNAHGQSILRVMTSDRVLPGSCFAPMHWTGETASAARINTSVTAVTDPISGQPSSKSARVSVAPFRAAWFGFALSESKPAPDCAYWTRTRSAKGWRMELAGEAAPADWTEAARAMLGARGEAVTIEDPRRGLFRVAFVEDGRITAALFAGPQPVALARDYLDGLLGGEDLHLLAGRAGADRPDPGPTLCACFNVGINTIVQAIEQKGLMTVEAIGAALEAGTNCGSCKPEIAALIARHATPPAAAAE